MIWSVLASDDMSLARGVVGSTRRARALLLTALLTIALSAGPALTGCSGRGTENRAVATGPSQLQEDVDAAVSTVESYWSAFFDARGLRFTPVESVFAYDSADDGSCGGQAFTPNNAFYCRPGDFIAYDVNFLAQQYVSIGDAFVFYLIGHEYGHAVQSDLGITHRRSILHELQADCLSGAYLGDSVRQEVLQIEDGDIDELVASLASVGDQPTVPWFAEGAHGSGQQRTKAFARGYNGTSTGGSSVAACFDL